MYSIYQGDQKNVFFVALFIQSKKETSDAGDVPLFLERNFC